MKTLLRIVGSAVLALVLIGFLLFKLNEKGFISGALSQWVSSVTGHILGIGSDTKDFLEQEGIQLPTPKTPEPVNPGAPTQPEQTQGEQTVPESTLPSAEAAQVPQGETVTVPQPGA